MPHGEGDWTEASGLPFRSWQLGSKGQGVHTYFEQESINVAVSAAESNESMQDEMGYLLFFKGGGRDLCMDNARTMQILIN